VGGGTVQVGGGRLEGGTVVLACVKGVGVNMGCRLKGGGTNGERGCDSWEGGAAWGALLPWWGCFWGRRVCGVVMGRGGFCVLSSVGGVMMPRTVKGT